MTDEIKLVKPFVSHCRIIMSLESPLIILDYFTTTAARSFIQLNVTTAICTKNKRKLQQQNRYVVTSILVHNIVDTEKAKHNFLML